MHRSDATAAVTPAWWWHCGAVARSPVLLRSHIGLSLKKWRQNKKVTEGANITSSAWCDRRRHTCPRTGLPTCCSCHQQAPPPLSSMGGGSFESVLISRCSARGWLTDTCDDEPLVLTTSEPRRTLHPPCCLVRSAQRGQTHQIHLQPACSYVTCVARHHTSCKSTTLHPLRCSHHFSCLASIYIYPSRLFFRS